MPPNRLPQPGFGSSKSCRSSTNSNAFDDLPPTHKQIPNATLIILFNTLLLEKNTQQAEFRIDRVRFRYPTPGRTYGYAACIDGACFLKPEASPPSTFTEVTGVKQAVSEVKPFPRDSRVLRKKGLTTETALTNADWNLALELQEMSQLVAWMTTHLRAYNNIAKHELISNKPCNYQRVSLSQCSDEIWINFSRYDDSARANLYAHATMAYPFEPSNAAHTEALFKATNAHITWRITKLSPHPEPNLSYHRRPRGQDGTRGTYQDPLSAISNTQASLDVLNNKKGAITFDNQT
ncbi:hypothetical protein EJ05DRAFT_523540 [Pseudovirgaria hyperparasitica]|uniref:Uncharacterized protein n=1 Tax=Pseudovirgaria hyperparasitica TaxID=470096 RepID=A0A6A6VUQ3_9PEZI|nr:uncharacterized protein EJ05DRAFT_523540 [Pseudovirgaria hyperparasitica]KAF2752981.1 hypothetical protein EJ05DRAFT_523540 [Pseudovirgaria hyperparasitica]